MRLGGGWWKKIQKKKKKYSRVGVGGKEVQTKKKKVGHGWAREKKSTCANQPG